MGNCNCFHHGLNKVLVVLVWLSALGFWWATAFKMSFMWIDGQHFFMDVVVLSLLLLTSKFCGCCRHGMGGSNMCMHGDSCKCGDCSTCK